MKLHQSNEKYSRAVGIVEMLHVWSDGEQCVSCWKMSWRERLSAFLFGCVWLSCLSGRSQVPVALWASRNGFRVERRLPTFVAEDR
jgi:hypothetical protein